MDSIAFWSEADRSDLLEQAAAIKGLPTEIIEKDFWVCWTLHRLFSAQNMRKKILFKGGTSLSKVFGLIERFSEDVDVILDWKEITDEDPNADRSVTKQDQFNKALLANAHAYLRDHFLPEVQDLVGDVCEATIADNPEIVNIRYPAAFSNAALRPDIQLEVGPLASWAPNAEYEIRSYVAEALPQQFKQPTCKVHATLAERTFWEKITILHHEAHRPKGNTQPNGYSRHYYDVFQMARATVKTDALANLKLLRAVVAFKDKFYHRGWARYDLAAPGSIRLIPPKHVMDEVRRDYDEMRFMIFGDRPEFEEMMASLGKLEMEINALPSR
jgi:hypothetical protein